MDENEKNPQEKDVLKAAFAEGVAEEEARKASGASAETPEERGEQIGAALEAEGADKAAEAATGEGQARDRKTHRTVIIAAVAFAVLLIGAGVAYNVLAPAAETEKVEVTGTDAVHETDVDPEGDTGEGTGANATTPAPDFLMTNAEGKTLSLADFRGRPVLLNFWASWCGPCQSEMPDIQKAWEAHAQDIDFVIVNMTGMSGETEQAARTFLADNGYTFPVYFDKDSSAAAAFGVNSIPQTYLIDAEGNILGGYMGAMTSSIIDEGIQMLLNTAKD